MKMKDGRGMHRARLVANDRGQQDEGSPSSARSRWAHDVGKPEKGCLLLAHPLMFDDSQGYFSQVCLHTHAWGAILCSLEAKFAS